MAVRALQDPDGGDEALRSSLAKRLKHQDRHINSLGQRIVHRRDGTGAAGDVVRCRGSRSGGGGAGADCRPPSWTRCSARAKPRPVKQRIDEEYGMRRQFAARGDKTTRRASTAS